MVADLAYDRLCLRGFRQVGGTDLQVGRCQHEVCGRCKLRIAVQVTDRERVTV